MGKPCWSKEEEDYFRDVIIPQSKYATGELVADSGLEFAELVSSMQTEMNRQGVARRIYTGEGLFQHWYQRFSNRARDRHQHTTEQPLTVATTPGSLVAELDKRNSRRNATPSTQSGTPPARTSRRRADSFAPSGAYIHQSTQTNVVIAPYADTAGEVEIRNRESIHLAPPALSFDNSTSVHVSNRVSNRSLRYAEDTDDEDDGSPILKESLKPTKKAMRPSPRVARNMVAQSDGRLGSQAAAVQSMPAMGSFPSPEYRPQRSTSSQSPLSKVTGGRIVAPKRPANSLLAEPAKRPKSSMTMEEALRQAMKKKNEASGHSETAPTQSADSVELGPQTSKKPYSRRRGLKPIRSLDNPNSQQTIHTSHVGDLSELTSPLLASPKSQQTLHTTQVAGLSDNISPLSTTPKSRLGLDQPTFDISPGLSFFSPASEINTPSRGANPPVPRFDGSPFPALDASRLLTSPITSSPNALSRPSTPHMDLFAASASQNSESSRASHSPLTSRSDKSKAKKDAEKKASSRAKAILGEIDVDDSD
ncbi:uncharacterized protein LY89DRAFT_729423 [Mollisia scopiformis]|uniref:Uncharacterized protein n=1 Tax=Mollisia scopiformis TaxID=149040 RepID=A0A194XP45_MOLSC|nr:uncharacterized protein LY89DRAFT_729423 [Mollisia scopiformis]KUJ21936.1 hypothetical protein LY89DRAFT_729423 [Mollisia scopiformis]